MQSCSPFHIRPPGSLLSSYIFSSFALIHSIRGPGSVFPIQSGAGGDFVGVEIGGADPEVQGRVSAGIHKKLLLIQNEKSFQRGTIPEINPDLSPERETLFAGERFDELPPFRPPGLDAFAGYGTGGSRKIECHLAS
jgi:hypothetical protein